MFVLLATLVVVLISTLFNQRTILYTALQSKAIAKGIIVICFLQSFYGILQLLNWFPSYNANFALTGSFDNPAGFAAVLAMGFPIELFLLSKTKRTVERCLVSTGLVVIVLATFLSGSRTGVLAILISSFVFFLLQTNIISKFKQYKFHKLLLVFIFCLLVSGAFTLYHQKKDSANGRLLIWGVSSEMIKAKPVFGHGYGKFQVKYMDNQAKYFKNNPDSKYAQLADNVKHPFNEFIKVAVEFGIVGLIVLLSFFLVVLWKIIKSENENRGLVLSGLTSFFVVAFFSYPLQYIAVWLLIAFYLLALLPSKEIRIRNSPVSIIARIAIAGICVFSLFHVSLQIRAEIKWKTIAVNSLRGNTEKMLPEFEKLYSTSLKQNPFFLYNYGAELNFVGKYDESIEILSECQQYFNDYDLQMLLADNYNKIDKPEMAIQTYEYASCMIPCRFIPLYQIFKTYKQTGQQEKAIQYANKIISKEVKIPSITVTSIISEAKQFLKKHKSTFGNKAIIRQPWHPQHIEGFVFPKTMHSN